MTAPMTVPITAPTTAAMTPPLLDHAGIAERIPHSGAMCLLDRVDAWDADHLVCSARSHCDAANPLRSRSGLLASCAIEYAAQAMALHGALTGADAGSVATPGYLASARGVRLHRLRLDDLDGDLQIEAVRQAGDTTQILYSFSVTHAGAPLADGRATVVLDTPLAS